ncbi:hypothetical protein PVK06_023688 [Gossypium arboreum]|uniref:Uncharacterized protein n=1 Tax=Gossypium arboreum TaxID=29729 RepID=A0ABR0PCA9_GOSAR|nr:hypothetical protein PVK06_023688 [Gossypium arboreum]
MVLTTGNLCHCEVIRLGIHLARWQDGEAYSMKWRNDRRKVNSWSSKMILRSGEAWHFVRRCEDGANKAHRHRGALPGLAAPYQVHFLPPVHPQRGLDFMAFTHVASNHWC